MKIKLLVIGILISMAFTGCLKDSNQPVNHINDVNIALMGTWTNVSSVTTYYDAAGVKVFSISQSLPALQFDNTTSLKEISTSGTTVTLNYNITTEGNTDFINVDGDPTPSQYVLNTLQAKVLTLSEILNYIGGTQITVNNNVITYYKSIMVNSYRKKDAPQN